MYTIYDYLKYYGEITIDQIKWNVQDNLICSLLSYLPFESFNKKYNLIKIWIICVCNFQNLLAYTLNHFKNSFQIYTISVGKRSGKYTKKFL